jgi:hypothetical protein
MSFASSAAAFVSSNFAAGNSNSFVAERPGELQQGWLGLILDRGSILMCGVAAEEPQARLSTAAEPQAS